MTVDELKTHIKNVLQDPTIEYSLDQFIEEERLSFSAEYELPSLKLFEPVTLSVTTATWLYDMPATYQKKVFRARNGDTNGAWLPIHRDIAAIERMDFDHTETDTYVSEIAVEDRKIAVYPKANDTLSLFYYKKPDVADDIDEIPDEWAAKVLVPRIVLRAFRVYPELARENIAENPKALDYWRTRQRESLYGSVHTGEIGYLNTLVKNKPPRRRGGRDPLP